MALTQIDDRGLKTPIDLLDNEKIRLGTGNDLELYHDGNTYIDNTNDSCDLRIQSDTIELKASSADEILLKGVKDGAVKLYYDNDKKFETRSNGIMAMGSSGDVAVNIKAPDNISQSRVIFSDATNTDGIITYDHNDRKMHLGAGTATATDGDLIIDSSGNVGIGTTSTGSYPVSATARKVQVEIKGAINTSDNTHQGHLALNCTNASAALHIIRSENDQTNGRGIGQVIFSASDGTDIHPVASIQASRDDTGANNDQPGRLEFLTTADGASQATERMRLDSSGRLMIGTTTEGHDAADELTVANTSGNAGITIRSADDGVGVVYYSDGTSGAAEYRGAVQYNHTDNYLRFYVNGSETIRFISGGGITFNGDSAAANALDDYEYGEWTPVLQAYDYNNSNDWTNVSYDNALDYTTGRYIKVGCMVYFWWYSGNFSLDSGYNTLSARISGLPYVFINNDPYYGGTFTFTHTNCFKDTSNNLTGIYTGYGRYNSTYFYPNIGNSSNNARWGSEADRYLMVSGTYQTNV